MTLKSWLITCMIRIHIPVNIYSLTQCLRCIIRYFFHDVIIKLEPLGLLAETFSKLILRVHGGRIHNKLGVRIIIEICKYVEALV